MISNQNNANIAEGQHRLRVYGQNERASSTSSNGAGGTAGGPKWTSSISDMLMNRTNTIKFNNQGAAQSHQTSQHQLLSQQHPSTGSHHPQSISHLHSHQTQQPMSNAGQQVSGQDGGRMMMKLMNIGAASHHQVTTSNISANANTFDHARLSGSRDDQKRLALDECTNYLQQKTMQQHFPSTSMAIQNIINSNRSASSAGMAIPPNGGAASVNNAVGKKFQAFKFNLTLNKNKGAPSSSNVGDQTTNLAEQQNFYQQPQHPSETTGGYEDNDAIVINEKHRKQMNSLSRGGGPNQLAMKQHLKQMIKSYEDQQPQPTNQSLGGGTEGTHRFDTLQHQTQQIQNDQQLTYDNTLKMTMLQGVQTSQKVPIASSTSSKPLDKKVNEIEERQKIFEEEIIKRVKEIQNYAKTLHMHLKKLQQTQSKKGEELQAAKDQLMQLKDITSKGDLSEEMVSAIIEDQIKALDSEVNYRLSQLEQRLSKDYEVRLQKQTKLLSNEMQIKIDSLKEEIQTSIVSESFSNLKAEVMKQVGERLKEVTRSQERTSIELRECLQEQSSQVEQVISEQQTLQRDWTFRHDKITKSVADLQVRQDQSFKSVEESNKYEIDYIKSKLMTQFQSELQISNQTINQQVQVLSSKIEQIEHALNQQATSDKTKNDNSQEYAEMLEELQTSLRDEMESIRQECDNSIETKLDQQNGQLQSIQEAYLQLKSHQSNLSLTFSERFEHIEAKLEDQRSEFTNQIESIDENFEQMRSQKNSKTTTSSVDNEKFKDSIMKQLQTINESFQQLQEQQDQIKQQMVSKLMRSELQEVKGDIDDELQSLEKVLKKHEDRVTSLEILNSQAKDQIEQLETQTDEQVGKIETKVIQANEQAQQRCQQLSDDLQSKTNDLYEEIQDLQQRLEEVQTHPQTLKPQEGSPERKSRSDAMAALKASFDSQLEDIELKLVTISSAVSEKLDIDTFESVQAHQEVASRAEQSRINAALEASLNSLSVYASKSSLKDLKEKVETDIDETIAMVNELDRRISTIEEKDYKSQATEEDRLPVYNDQIETIQGQLEELQLLVNAKFESLSVHSQELIELKHSLQSLQSTQQKEIAGQEDQNDQFTHDIKSLRELNACLQDVTVTQDEFSDLTCKFETLAKDNENLNQRIEELQKQQSQNNFDSMSLKTSLMESVAAESKVNLESNINELRITLDERFETVQEEIVNYLNGKLESLNHAQQQQTTQSLEVKPQLTDGRRQDNIETKPSVTGLNNFNYMSTPRAYDSQSPLERNRQPQQHHFLEDLSEVVSSPNIHGGEREQLDGDMMIFNNLSRQSMSSASMLGNSRLMTPVQSRGGQFQFNSQINAGQRLPMTLNEESNNADSHIDVEDQQEEAKELESQGSLKTSSPVFKASPESKRQSIDEDSDQDDEPNEAESAEEVIQIKNKSPQIKATEALPFSPDQEEYEKESSSDEIEQQFAEIVSVCSEQEDAVVDPEYLNEPEEGNEEFLQTEEAKSESSLENSNVEEVLGDLKNPSVQGEDQVSQDCDFVDIPRAEVLLLSPVSILAQDLHSLTAVNMVQGANLQQTGQQQQNNHFVAFESDEEEVLQYDLLPISHSPRVSILQPVGQASAQSVIGNPQLNSRNRYYESGSGGEDEDHIDEDPFNRPGDQDIEDRLNQDDITLPSSYPWRLEAQNEVEQQESESEEENDGVPFEAQTSSRSNIEEEHKHLEDSRDSDSQHRLDYPHGSDNEDGDPVADHQEFQAIHHETLSSHRSSELSQRNSIRSGSLNLDHNHDNIDVQDEADAREIEHLSDEEEKALESPRQEAPVVAEESSQNEADQFNNGAQFEIDHSSNEESAKDDVGSLENRSDLDSDAWDVDALLEDAQPVRVLESEDEDFQEEEDEVENQASIAASNLEEPKKQSSEQQAESVANWIVEQEILQVIQMALMLKQRGGGALKDYLMM